MKNRLRILYLSSEVAPFAKTGGLADVASALPKALYEKGHDIRIMMPKYGSISERKFTLREVIRLKTIPIQMGDTVYQSSAKSAFIPDTKVQVYFFDNKPYYDQPDLYVDSKTGKDYQNNAERFALFSRAALEIVKLLHWEPQIIHCNDWQTALVPWLLKNDYSEDPFFAKTCSMLSIHNLAYQGNFSPTSLPALGMQDSLKEVGSDFEFYGKINFLKAGILNSDIVTTVSPTYAVEIQNDQELGAGLQGVLQQRKQDLFGILNGVDYSIWNPESDPLIEANFGAANLKGKEQNKISLLEQVGLPYIPKVPLIGIISRLDEQKGFDLIGEAINDIIKMNAQVVILGTGQPHFHTLLEKISKSHPNQVAAQLVFDNKLAHLIEAGSDMFLMPSRYEPCGLNQMYSLRYGTIPIVRKTGGLADTICDYIANPSKGNGFVFEAYNAKAMLKTIHNAVQAYKDEKNWQKLVKRCMRQDFSWEAAAEKYIKLYTKLENCKRKK
jgi:starch synthase